MPENFLSTRIWFPCRCPIARIGRPIRFSQEVRRIYSLRQAGGVHQNETKRRYAPGLHGASPATVIPLIDCSLFTYVSLDSQTDGCSEHCTSGPCPLRNQQCPTEQPEL